MAEFRRRRAKLRVKAEEIDYKNVDLLKKLCNPKSSLKENHKKMFIQTEHTPLQKQNLRVL